MPMEFFRNIFQVDLAIAFEFSHTVSAIDTKAANVVSTISFALRPHGIDIDPVITRTQFGGI